MASYAGDATRDTTRKAGDTAASMVGKAAETAGRLVGSVEEAAAGIADRTREAREGLGEVSDNLYIAIRKSVKKQPTTSLLVATAAGFVLGAIWKS